MFLKCKHVATHLESLTGPNVKPIILFLFVLSYFSCTPNAFEKTEMPFVFILFFFLPESLPYLET